MSNLQPSQVVSRANTELCRIDRLTNMYHLSPQQRMVLITRIAEEFRTAVTGCTRDPFRQNPQYVGEY